MEYFVDLRRFDDDLTVASNQELLANCCRWPGTEFPSWQQAVRVILCDSVVAQDFFIFIH